MREGPLTSCSKKANEHLFPSFQPTSNFVDTVIVQDFVYRKGFPGVHPPQDYKPPTWLQESSPTC